MWRAAAAVGRKHAGKRLHKPGLFPLADKRHDGWLPVRGSCDGNNRCSLLWTAAFATPDSSSQGQGRGCTTLHPHAFGFVLPNSSGRNAERLAMMHSSTSFSSSSSSRGGIISSGGHAWLASQGIESATDGAHGIAQDDVSRQDGSSREVDMGYPQELSGHEGAGEISDAANLDGLKPPGSRSPTPDGRGLSLEGIFFDASPQWSTLPSAQALAVGTQRKREASKQKSPPMAGLRSLADDGKWDELAAQVVSLLQQPEFSSGLWLKGFMKRAGQGGEAGRRFADAVLAAVGKQRGTGESDHHSSDSPDPSFSPASPGPPDHPALLASHGCRPPPPPASWKSRPLVSVLLTRYLMARRFAAESVEAALAEAKAMCRTHALAFDNVLFAIFIETFCRKGQIYRAMDLMEEMHREGMPITFVVFNSFLREFSRAGMMEEAMSMFAVMKSSGMRLAPSTFCILVDGFTAAGNLAKVEELIAEAKVLGMHTNSYMSNVLLNIYCKRGQVEEAVRLTRELKQTGFAPSVITFTQLLHGCALQKNLQLGLEVWRMMHDAGVNPNDFCQSAMVELLVKTDDLESAIAHANSVIQKTGKLHGRIAAALIEGLVRANRVPEAIAYFRRSKAEGSCPQPYAVHGLLMALGRRGDLEAMTELYYETADTSLWPSMTWQRAVYSCQMLASVVLESCIMHGDLARSVEILRHLQSQNRVSHHLLIQMLLAGMYTEHNPNSAASSTTPSQMLDLFILLRKEGFAIGRAPLDFLLDFCWEKNDVEVAKGILHEMGVQNLPLNFFNLFRVFKVAVSAEDEDLACQMLSQMSLQDLADPDAQILLWKTLEPHLEVIQNADMAQDGATLPHVREAVHLALLHANLQQLELVQDGDSDTSISSQLEAGDDRSFQSLAEILAEGNAGVSMSIEQDEALTFDILEEGSGQFSEIV